MSSAAVMEPVEKEERKPLVLVPQPEAAQTWRDWEPHPMVLVFAATVIALIGTATAIGAVLTWLALRHSGVMAP